MDSVKGGPPGVDVASGVGRRLYAYDAMGEPGAVPTAVFFPKSAAEVAAVLAWARTARMPVVARGAGTGLSGGSVPGEGAVVLSFEKMNRIRGFDLAARTIEVEPGVVNGLLDEFLQPHGLLYAPDPASRRAATIGGNIAENSGGPHALKYGITGLHIRALTVLDAAGRKGHFATGARQPGPDLASLVIGSEGTLGVVTSATLVLLPRPEAVATALLSFGTLAAATDFVSALIASGLLPATAEFLDRPTIDAVEGWGVARYPPGSAAVLIVEFDGAPDEVAQGMAGLGELAAGHGALRIDLARDEAERDRLWLGRRGAYAAVGRLGRRLLTQDVTVPRQRLTAMLQAVGEIAERFQILVATVGHAGDGNLHPDFPYDPDDPDLSRRVHAANVEVMRACVALDGSITGEHGVGTDKLPYLGLMYGPAELGLMAAVKEALDPDGLLNPGKAVPAVPPSHAKVPSDVPAPVAALLDGIADARRQGAFWRGGLDAFTSVTVDPANLTVEAGAGIRLDDLRAKLAQDRLSLSVTTLVEAVLGRAILASDSLEGAFGDAWRQHVLAATYVTGTGELVRMGRPVMKNVAGYDLFRLLIGSRGKLGVPVSFCLRLAPTAPGAAGDGPTEVQRAALSLGSADVLDLACTPGRLPDVVGALSHQPPVLLRQVARLRCRVAEDEARRAVAAAGEGARAMWNGRDLSLRDDLGAAWERALAAVFDPNGILGAWFEGGSP